VDRGAREARFARPPPDGRSKTALPPRLNPTTPPHAQRPQATCERDARQSSRARRGPPGRIPMPSQRHPLPSPPARYARGYTVCQIARPLRIKPPAPAAGRRPPALQHDRARGIRGKQPTQSRGTHCALSAAASAARPDGANMQPPRARSVGHAKATQRLHGDTCRLWRARRSDHPIIHSAVGSAIHRDICLCGLIRWKSSVRGPWRAGELFPVGGDNEVRRWGFAKAMT
jgi:hypothetical protein